jgi:hypothetical protein
MGKSKKKAASTFSDSTTEGPSTSVTETQDTAKHQFKTEIKLNPKLAGNVFLFINHVIFVF